MREKLNILRNFINGKEIKDNKMKINMIITEELSNINRIFENCAKLTEFSINEDIIITDNEFEDEDKD